MPAPGASTREPEPILEPDLPIVDAHCHIVSTSGVRYLGPELAADMATGHRIEASVFVESPAGGAAPLATLAGDEPAGPFRHGRLATGMIGCVDLARGAAVEESLQACVAALGERFKGVRCAAAFDRDPAIVRRDGARAGLLREPGFRAGAKVLQALGLSLDVWAFFHQMDEVAALADALPALKIVVNHCGGPLGHGPYEGREHEVLVEWGRKMTALARRPNVSVKLGGLLARQGTRRVLDFDIDEPSTVLAGVMRPFVLGTIERFGAGRCMFASNFPVEKIVTGYAALWNAYKRLTAAATPHEKAALYGGTAQRVYRLA